MKKSWSRFLSFIKKPENVFISLSLFFGVLSAILVPQLSVSDENMHYMRAYGISQGRVESNSPCTLPKDVIKRAEAVYEGSLDFEFICFKGIFCFRLAFFSCFIRFFIASAALFFKSPSIPFFGNNCRSLYYPRAYNMDLFFRYKRIAGY